MGSGRTNRILFWKLLAGSGEADLQALGFADPPFALGFVDAADQVVTDLGQQWSLRGVRPQQAVADHSGDGATGCTLPAEAQTTAGPRSRAATWLPSSAAVRRL